MKQWIGFCPNRERELNISCIKFRETKTYPMWGFLDQSASLLHIFFLMTMCFQTQCYSIPNQSWLMEKNTFWFYLVRISLPTLGCPPVWWEAGLCIIRSEYILISMRSMETQSPPWPPEPSVDRGCLLWEEGKHEHSSVIEQKPLQKCLWAFVPGLQSSGGPPLQKAYLCKY